MAINETVLEMHFHRPLMDLFRRAYGVGRGGQINFYKYSPQKEVFVGFDQAYAMTELSDDEFFNMLKTSAMTARYKLPKKFLAYFLQFKVVRSLSNIQKSTPVGIRNKPHFRVKLDTQKNQNTGFSQHELLYDLKKNDQAMVYYACPMIFDKSALYEIQVDLNQLRFVGLDSCPSQFSDNDRHHIYFNSQTASPIWCSEPAEGESIGALEFARQVLEQLQQLDAVESAQQVLKILHRLQGIAIIEPAKTFDGEPAKSAISFVHDSLTIIEVEAVETSNA